MHFSSRRSSFASRIVAITCLGIATLALQACGTDKHPADGKTSPHPSATGSYDPTLLRRGNGPEPDTLDPQVARTDASFNILRDLFEGLTSVGPDGSAVPGAAESWTVSPDGREYVFKLRPGLRWSNGDPVKAATT